MPRGRKAQKFKCVACGGAADRGADLFLFGQTRGAGRGTRKTRKQVKAQRFSICDGCINCPAAVLSGVERLMRRVLKSLAQKPDSRQMALGGL